jgi:transcriptional regulator GlxA family with amidase domain
MGWKWIQYWRWPTFRGLAGPTISRGKLTWAQKGPPRGTGRTDVPGAQLAAVHGLNDLFAVANRIAAERQAAQLPVLRVSHWKADAEQTPQRVYDSHPGADSHLLAVLIPPSLGSFSAASVSAQWLQWLRDQHARGATLGGVCGVDAAGRKRPARRA